MKHQTKTFSRLLTVLLIVSMLIGLISVQAFAVGGNDNNQNNQSAEVEEWVYTTGQQAKEEPAATVLNADSIAAASTDIVEVTVTAKNRSSGDTENIAGADVNLYVGSRFISTTKTNSKGIAEVSLTGLNATDRKNATISASKVVSRGKGIDGTARDNLFKHFPKDSDGDYYRYSLELHSEKIDKEGNWKGKALPNSYESNKIDIVFVIDGTGSMSEEINNVKTNIASFSENLINKGLDIRFCIVEYRDITEGEPTIVHAVDGSHWLKDIDSVVSELASIRADGGGDGPETVLDPLGYVADNSQMLWRSDAFRFAFVLTDANYKTNNNYGYTSLQSVTDQLKKMDVVTSVITSSSYKSTYSGLYSGTGGIYADINSSKFNEEMLSLSDSIITSVTRKMTLNLSEPRLLVNLSTCYFADDETSQSEGYRQGVKNVLNEYAKRLAETTDGHVLIDKMIVFSTDNRLDFYDTAKTASMADIRIEAEVSDSAGNSNVQVHSNAYVTGFFSDSTYSAVYNGTDKTEHFSNLKDGSQLNGRKSFYRIQMSGLEGAGWDYSMLDQAYKYSTTITHETGHYLLGFFDEYLDANGDWWNDGDGIDEDDESPYTQPYEFYGLMDNQHDDIEMSKTKVDYSYIKGGFSGAAISDHTKQSYRNGGSCEDSLATLLTGPNFNSYYFKDDIINSGYSLGDYVGKYTKVQNKDRDAKYDYAALESGDFILLRDNSSGGGSGGGGGSSFSAGAHTESLPADFTQIPVAIAEFSGSEHEVTVTVTEETGCAYQVEYRKNGEDDFTEVTLKSGAAVLPIAKGELAEVHVIATKGSDAKYNTYFIDRSEDTETGYLYNSVDHSVEAYVTTSKLSSYTFVADNTVYLNGDYRSVNQATRIYSDRGEGFDSGEIYSVADYLDNIDYSTLSWFKFADGKWTALDTDLKNEENLNIGARADLDGDGLYVLMAKTTPSNAVIPAQNLRYEQSTDRDAVVTLKFTDANPNSKFYNVYYSDTEFSSKDDDGVVVRSFRADSTDLTINLLERGRTVYAAVEIVLEDGSRSALSDIILVGGAADSDGDGIPDWYCDQYLLWGEDGENKDIAGSDDDGDGLTNLEEYQGGSDPTDPDDPVHTSNVPVDSVSVSQSALKLSVGESVTVTATVLPANATNQSVNWTSSNPDVAAVKASGSSCTITAVGLGEAEVYAVTVDGGFSAVVSVNVTDTFPLVDVKKGSYYYDAVYWAYTSDPQITTGMGPDHFYPNMGCTRGQLIAMIWRAAGCPAPTVSEMPFNDIPKDAYYYDAILWAYGQGIANGTGDDTFSPNLTSTRSDIITFLWRLKGAPAPALTSNPFEDVPSGEYYEEAVLWAVENGITTGVSPTKFCPGNTCTRAQVVTFLYRLNGK